MTNSGVKVSIFIPAYNAVKHIEAVVARIPGPVREGLVSVWIVDDGSTDGTGELIDRMAERDPVIKPVHFAYNRGYGNAVGKGLELCRAEQIDYAACIHADGQYPPESIPLFVNHMREKGIDICQGSRIASGTALSGGMPLYKYVSGKVLTFFENQAFKLHMTDYHSGFLVYSRKALESIPFDRLSRSFDFDLEVIASARAKGLIVDELPIPTRYAGEVSYLNPVTYGLRVVGVVMRYLVGGYSHL